jgi:hypothetical protein
VAASEVRLPAWWRERFAKASLPPALLDAVFNKQ